MDDRLPAALEARAIMRAVETAGGHAMLLQKGDRDRGALVLMLLEKDRHMACYERELTMQGRYEWTRTGPDENAGNQAINAFIERKKRGDPDLWILELTVADAQGFADETLSRD